LDALFTLINSLNAVMLSIPVLITLLAVGVGFTFWSGFSQYRSLTHGVALASGRGIQTGHGEGVLTHFQALSAALSATVGLGNIGGVAIAVALGGPGAVFWMWVVAVFGMAIKSAEVWLAMLYRDTSDPANPRGGTMYVAREGLKQIPGLRRIATFIGAAFCIPLILFGITGGNMFQAWNVAEISHNYFGIPTWISGVILAAVVGLVILGGIQRIGRIAATLVPVMCGIYVLAGLVIIGLEWRQLPVLFGLIISSAFQPAEAGGAFMGATIGVAFIFGMKRALFSSEAGLGSAPIAHAAVKTPEPATEGIVAGLEPFIDTIVVCTITALVILVSGVWNRPAEAQWVTPPAFTEVAPGQWQPDVARVPEGLDLRASASVFVIVHDGDARSRIFANVAADGTLTWRPHAAAEAPELAERGLFADYPAATLTARAFDHAFDGLGRWMVVIAVWLFAVSTLITWSYYSEQGLVYLMGTGGVTAFRVIWCGLIVLATVGLIRTDVEIDSLSTVAMGFMLFINLPLLVLLGHHAMRSYRDYIQRLDAKEIDRR
jgi:alanine or glycine:cation symporter, AGCS family